MLPSIASPQPSTRISTLQETPRVSKTTQIPSLEVGENLNVLVLSSSLERKTLLQIKNSTVLAYSPFPLQSGETLTVRVDQLHPMIVLRMILREDAEISKTNEFLKLYRSNPAALKEMITSVKEYLAHDNLKVLGKYLSKEDIQNMIKVTEKIIISKNNMTNPLFLKDSMVALGLAGERRLMKSLSDPKILSDEKNNTTLKGILLKLSSELTPIPFPSEYTKHDTQIIRQFSHFADHATTVIESLQIVNIMAQEQDGLFMLQIPFQFPEGIRIQDLYIESDRNRRADESGKQCRIVLFLDMDTLGELTVDAGIQDKVIQCTLKCSDQRVFDFLQTLLPELHKTLSGIDYVIGNMQCVLDRDIRSWKYDYLQKHSIFSQSVIDLSV
jgi:hypothetical protein